MNEFPRPAMPAARRLWVGALLGTAAGAACAQLASTPSAGGGLSSDPSPYYIGASQAVTHDSNAYRVPFGASDTYYSTSLLGGFDQAFSRQRVFGSASVTLNRYQNQTTLNNTSYGLLAGLDWATIWRLSGNVTTTLDQSLAAPAATVANPDSTRNVQKRKGLTGVARWGGDSVISLEGRAGYSSQDYGGQSSAANSESEFGSIGAFYQPGTRLRLGVALRADRTTAPDALLLPDGSFQGNNTHGRNIDFLADYNNGSSLNASGRISYTRQTNSSADNADFSGLTGSINVGYRATGKLAFNVGASRDAGYNAANGGYGGYVPAVVVTTPPTTVTPTSPVGTTTLYQNNQVTNSGSVGASYSATSKIGVNASARYAKARIVTASGSATAGSASADVSDVSRSASLGANYAYSRALTFACSVARERREVSGAVSYGYTNDSAACSAQFLWR